MLRKRCPMPDGIRSAFGKPFRSLWLHPSGRVFVRAASSSVSSGTCAVSVGGTVRRAVPAVTSVPDLPSYRVSSLCLGCLGCVCICLPVSVSCLCLSSLSPSGFASFLRRLRSCLCPCLSVPFPFLNLCYLYPPLLKSRSLSLSLSLSPSASASPALLFPPLPFLIRRGFVLREVSRNKSSFVGMVHSATGTPAAVPLIPRGNNWGLRGLS